MLNIYYIYAYEYTLKYNQRSILAQSYMTFHTVRCIRVFCVEVRVGL